MPNPDVPIYKNQLPRIAPAAGLRLREDTLYSDAKGREKKKIRKAVEKSLNRVGEVLRSVLTPDEAILLAARARFLPGMLQQFFARAEVAPEMLLVFTNRRLIMLRVKGKGFSGWEWDRGIQNVFWGDLEKAKMGGWLIPVLEVKDRGGSKERYWRISRENRRRMKAMIAAILPVSTADNSPQGTIFSLCPDCRAPLAPKVYRCNRCSLLFKDETTLLRRTLLIPAGGYFYVGVRWMGLLAGFIDVALLAGLCYWLLIAVGAVAIPVPAPGQVPQTRGDFLFVALIAALFIFILRTISFFQCRYFVRGFLPLKKALTTLG